MLAAMHPAWAVKAAPPLNVDLRLELPKAFPAAATAVFTATCQVAAPSLTLSLSLPRSYTWIAGATRMETAARRGATEQLVVSFMVPAATATPVEGRAVLEAGEGFRMERSSAIALLPPSQDRAAREPEEAPFEERDGTARYKGRTTVR